jgi:hypothetical protein
MSAVAAGLELIEFRAEVAIVASLFSGTISESCLQPKKKHSTRKEVNHGHPRQ